MKEKLYEEKGPYYMEDWCEQAGDSIENGSVKGDLSDLYGGYSYALTINGEDAETFFQSPDVKELILRDISYPVKDGHASYSGLDEIVGTYSGLDFTDEAVVADLVKLGFNEDEVRALANHQGDDDTEIETWIDYDINLNDSNVENDEDDEYEKEEVEESVKLTESTGSQKTVETIVPFFYGFYESIFEEYWNSKEEVGKIFTDVINKKIAEVLPSFSYTFQHVQSPKYYNYGTDEIYAQANFNLDEVLAFLSQNLEAFESYCKENFSDRDGFWSYLPNSAEKFIETMKTVTGKDESSFVFGAIEFIMEKAFGANIKNELNEEAYYDCNDQLEPDEYEFNDDDEVEEAYPFKKNPVCKDKHIGADNPTDDSEGEAVSESDYSVEDEGSCKDMIESILAYGGLNSSANEIIDSYYGERYLTKYVKQFGKKQVVKWIDEMKDMMDGTTGLNDEGYTSIKWKDGHKGSWRDGKKGNKQMNESFKDYLPRGGFMRDEEGNKQGAFFGQGTDEQLRKAKIIARVKFAQGDRFGRVTKEDLDNFEDYKEAYDEMFGSDEIDEGWKDNLKKAAGVAAVAGGLMASNPAHAQNIDPYEDNDIPPTEYSELFQGVKEIDQINQTVTDQYGNVWTFDEWQDIKDGNDPFGEGNPPEEIHESQDPTENSEEPAKKSEGDTEGHPISDFPVNDTEVKIDDISVRDNAWEELDLSGIMKLIDAEDEKSALSGNTAEETNVSLRTSTAKSTKAEMKPSENKEQPKSKEPEIDKTDQKDRILNAEKTKAEIHEDFEFKFNEEVLKEADNKGDVITFVFYGSDGFSKVAEVTNKSSGHFTADEIKKVFLNENPRIWFNNADAKYWFMDFSFEKDGKMYWISSDNIEDDKYKLSIYDGNDYGNDDDDKKLNEAQITGQDSPSGIDFLKTLDEKGRYMFLSRMQQDCKYFLGNGNYYNKFLWAGNVEDQIKYMKWLYNSFPKNKKPEWISMEEIEDYEKRMAGKGKEDHSRDEIDEQMLDEGVGSRGMIKAIEKAFDDGRYGRYGKWECGLGGYDTGYQVSYERIPFFEIKEDDTVKFLSNNLMKRKTGYTPQDVIDILSEIGDYTMTSESDDEELDESASFPKNKKPEWISMEEIEDYEKRMAGKGKEDHSRDEINESKKSDKIAKAYEEAYEVWNNAGSPEEYLFDICVDVAEKYGVDPSVIESMIEDAEMNNEADDLYEEKDYLSLSHFLSFDNMPSSWWKQEFEYASKSKRFDREWVEYCRHKYEEAVKKEKSGKLNEEEMLDEGKARLDSLHKLMNKCWYNSKDGKGARLGNWEMALGGYDKGYEFYYNNMPLFAINRWNEIDFYQDSENTKKYCGYTNKEIFDSLKSYRDLNDLKTSEELDESVDNDKQVIIYGGDIQFYAPKSLVMAFAHPGDNMEDAKALLPYVKKELSEYSDEQLKKLLREYGIEDADSKSREELELYTIWLCAWNFIDSDDPEDDNQLDESIDSDIEIGSIVALSDRYQNRCGDVIGFDGKMYQIDIDGDGSTYDVLPKDIIEVIQEPILDESARLKELASKMILREADESSVAKVKINSVEFKYKEGAQDDKNWVEGKTYSFEEFQKLVYEYDYAFQAQADNIGYDKLWYTADITVDYNGKQEHIGYDGRLDLGDGKYGLDSVSVAFMVKQGVAHDLGIDPNQVEILNPEVPYDSKAFVAKYGTHEENLDKFLADKASEIKTPKYSKDSDNITPEEIEVGDYFADNDSNGFYRVVRRSKASVWLERVKSKVIRVPYKNNRGELEYSNDAYPTTEPDNEDRWSWFDTSKPFRLGGYGHYVSASQGRHSLWFWGGKEIAESFAKKGKTLMEDEEVLPEADQQFENPFKEGDILFSSWGYSMRLVDFYKVISSSKSFVKLAHLQDYNSKQDEWGQAGYKMPKIDQVEPDSNVDGRRFKVHIRDDGKPFVKINNYEWAEMWDGKPKAFDTYD